MVVCRVCVHCLLLETTGWLSVSYTRQVGGCLQGCVICQLFGAGLLLSVALRRTPIRWCGKRSDKEMILIKTPRRGCSRNKEKLTDDEIITNKCQRIPNGAIKKGRSRETGNIGYKRRRQTQQKRHHQTQAITNKVNKPRTLIRTTGGKDKPNIVSMRKS